MILWNNNKLFMMDFLPNEAPKILFRQMEQCQEVAIIAEIPYTQAQLFSDTMHLLLKSRIFRVYEFKDLEAVPNKTWPIMKAFVHGAYAR